MNDGFDFDNVYEESGYRIVLLAAKETFMVKAILRDLKAAGFVCISDEADVAHVSALHDEADVFLLYLGGKIEERDQLLVYLKDLCIEEKAVVLIGEKQELDTALRVIPEELLSAVIQRPFDLSELVDTLNEIVLEIEASARKKTVLVIDDDTTFLKMAHEWLKDVYHVVIVSSGMQAFSYLAKNHADLILLDYNMPVASGPNVLEMLKSEKETKDIPVMFLTGQADAESIRKVMGLPMEKYLLKTVGRNGLRDTLAEFFAKQED